MYILSWVKGIIPIKVCAITTDQSVVHDTYNKQHELYSHIHADLSKKNPLLILKKVKGFETVSGTSMLVYSIELLTVLASFSASEIIIRSRHVTTHHVHAGPFCKSTVEWGSHHALRVLRVIYPTTFCNAGQCSTPRRNVTSIIWSCNVIINSSFLLLHFV